MMGTKFLVLRMKDIVKVGVIALVGLALIILALVFLLSGSGGQPPENRGADHIFIPGTYAATIILNNKPVEIQVTVSENEILTIDMSDLAAVQQVFYPLFEPRLQDLAREVLRYQTAYIAPATDYPVTTGILQQAVKAALEMAGAEH